MKPQTLPALAIGFLGLAVLSCAGSGVPISPSPVRAEATGQASDSVAESVRPIASTSNRGNQLEGTLTWTATSSADSGTTVNQVDAHLTLTLQANGTLTGTAEITYALHGEGTLDCGPWSTSIDPMQLSLPVDGKWTKETIVLRYTSAAPIMADQTMKTCGNSLTVQLPVTTAVLVGADWQGTWDGQAYTAEDRVSSSGVEVCRKIHLGPPAPALSPEPVGTC